MRFDDEERIDALEAQMKAVQKAVEDIPTQIDKLRKEITAEMDKRFTNKSADIDAVDKGAQKTATSVQTLDGDLKKALQRIATLEQQVKKLSK